VKASRGKKLGGAPPKGGRLTRARGDKRRPGQGTPGGFKALLVIAGLLLVGTGIYLFRLYGQLQDGILKQAGQERRRPDWVGLRQMPAYVPAAFLAVVDTGSFRTEASREPTEDPHVTRDLVRQVQLLGDGLGDRTREMAMTPLFEQQTSPQGRMELFLNRIDLGQTGNWQIFGVYHAAREYFNKSPQQLTVGDAATLAGILLPPRISKPEVVPGVMGVRRNEVLRRMRDAGTLDDAAYRAALAEPLAFQPGVEYAPMSRPADWKTAPAVIRVPLDQPASADSAKASPQSPGA
jgi:membrane peptidoglycan carboxypeptidase